jgi:hypothetical protein
MSHTFIAKVVTLATSLTVSTTTCADQRRSFYDRDGHFAGSEVKTSPNSSSFYDRRGHFSGSAHGRSFYDHDGKFIGSTR